ncbi:MAG: hypothetical protein OXH69_10050 [Acidobacteria bacterium]|nr:hypothetical protein [Acidobacteriota bacterium]
MQVSDLNCVLSTFSRTSVLSAPNDIARTYLHGTIEPASPEELLKLFRAGLQNVGLPEQLTPQEFLRLAHQALEDCWRYGR